MENVARLMDVEVESLMKKADDYDRGRYEDEIRKRQLSRTLPFDTRNEVSADARYVASSITKHLWIIGVVIPTVADKEEGRMLVDVELRERLSLRLHHHQTKQQRAAN
jgi:hypothetical protein